MMYLENYIIEFNQYFYKIRHDETNLDLFYNKLPYSINFVFNGKYISWHENLTSLTPFVQESLI